MGKFFPPRFSNLTWVNSRDGKRFSIQGQKLNLVSLMVPMNEYDGAAVAGLQAEFREVLG